MADTVADAVGINTHINYLRLDLRHGLCEDRQATPAGTGVRHIRDNPGGDLGRQDQGPLYRVARSGIRLLHDAPASAAT